MFMCVCVCVRLCEKFYGKKTLQNFTAKFQKKAVLPKNWDSICNEAKQFTISLLHMFI